MSRFILKNKTTNAEYVVEGTIPYAAAGQVPAGDYETRLITDPAVDTLSVTGPELYGDPTIVGTGQIGSTITASFSYRGAAEVRVQILRDGVLHSNGDTYIPTALDAGRVFTARAQARDQFDTWTSMVEAIGQVEVSGTLVTNPSPPGSGTIVVSNVQSISGDRITFQVNSPPGSTGGSPLTVLRISRTTPGVGNATTDIPYSGVGTYILTVPPAVASTFEAAFGNEAGLFSLFTGIAGSHTPTVITAEAPIALQVEYDIREEQRQKHLVGNAAYQNENTWMGFTPAEIATFTVVTCTTAEAVKTAIQGMTNSSKLKIICDWNGESAMADGTILGRPANALSAGATDHGKTRPDCGVYLEPAAGKTPMIAPSLTILGVSKIHSKNINYKYAVHLTSNTSYPLPPMGFFDGGTISPGDVNSCFRSTNARLLHVQNMEFPKGRMFSNSPHFLRMWNNTVYGGGDDVDIVAIRGYDSAISQGWESHIWFAGNHVSRVQKTLYVHSDAHLDLFQWGTGVDSHKGHNVLIEFNLFNINTNTERPGCQGMFSGDVTKPKFMRGIIHNNIMLVNGGKGIQIKDAGDTELFSQYRNMLGRGGYAHYEDTGQPSQYHRDPNAAVPASPGQKRIVECFGGGTSFDYRGAEDVVANPFTKDNVYLGASYMRNKLKGNGLFKLKTVNSISAGGPIDVWIYEDFDYVVDGTYHDVPENPGTFLDSASAKAAMIAFCEPLVGWRGNAAGPINPDTWPATAEDFAAALVTPPAPEMAVAPVTEGIPRVGEQLNCVTLGIWRNHGTRNGGWWAGNTDGTGNHLLTTDRNILLTADLEGKLVWWMEDNTNMTGAIWDTGTVYTVLPEVVEGVLFSEDWSREGFPLPSGTNNFWALCGPAGTKTGPKYSRNNSFSSMDVVANANAPQGKALRVSGPSSLWRYMWRDDIKAEMDLGWTALEVLMLTTHRTGLSNQLGFGAPGASAGIIFGAMLQNRTTRNMRLGLNSALPNGGTEFATDIVQSTSTPFWTKWRIDKNYGAPGITRRRAKSWLITNPEPSWGMDDTTSTDVSPLDRVGIITNSAGSIEVLSYSVRVIH